MSIKVGTLQWTHISAGRWCSSVLGHGGHLALHAFPKGAWAVTRGQAVLCKSDVFVVGSREEGQPIGVDLEGAMALAEAAALLVVEREHPDRQVIAAPVQHELFA